MGEVPEAEGAEMISSQRTRLTALPNSAFALAALDSPGGKEIRTLHPLPRPDRF